MTIASFAPSLNSGTTNIAIVGNAISWYQYDPTKWLIYALSKMGLAYDLKKFRTNEIEKGRLQQLQKKFDKEMDQKRSQLSWGKPLSELPVMEWDDFRNSVTTKDSALVAVGGVIHNVAPFILEHPGGKALISSGIGKDATAMFNGGVYEHSNAAHNILSTMRVGILRGGQEVEIWKREKGSSEQENVEKDCKIGKPCLNSRIPCAWCGGGITRVEL